MEVKVKKGLKYDELNTSEIREEQESDSQVLISFFI